MVGCWLLVVRCCLLLFVVRRVLVVGCGLVVCGNLLLIVCDCPSLVDCWVLYVVCCVAMCFVPLHVCCLPFVVCCMMCVVCCLLVAVCCALFHVCCLCVVHWWLLFVDCCLPLVAS